MRLDAFFEYARRREQARLRKEAGLAPFSEDPILKEWSFCNVEREHDRTTRWFADALRDTMFEDDPAQLLLATVAFRWFNRIETARVLCGQSCSSHANLFLKPFNSRDWSERLQDFAKPPYVTGAYIIKTPDGMPKQEGVLWCIEQFAWQNHPLQYRVGDYAVGYWAMAKIMMNHPGKISLEMVWKWLRQFPFMGDFMAYEVVTDLYHTPLLNKAPDIMMWANPGPGAARGLCRLKDAPLNGLNRSSKTDREFMLQLMRDILHASTFDRNWPSDWGAWDMRTVEHTLCEFDKYERVKQGGRLKRRYRAPAD